MSSIAFVTKGLGWGGAEKLLINLANYFTKNKKHKVIVIALSSNTSQKKFLSENVHLHYAKKRFRFDFFTPVFKIIQILREGDVDIVIPFGMYELFFIFFARKFLTKTINVFVSIHSTTQKNLYIHLQHFLYAKFLKNQDKIISVCQSQAKYWSYVYNIPLKQFHTIYNGVDTSYFTPDFPDSPILKTSLNITPNTFIITQVATLAEHKQQELSISALRELINLSPQVDWRLLLIGSGTPIRLSSLKKMATNLGVINHVHFLGVQSDVRPYLKLSSVFILPSNKVETFSVAALEAMSMDLPCILTNIGGASEMIRDEQNGYLIAIGSHTMLANRILDVYSGKISKNLPRQIVLEKFSSEDCFQNYKIFMGLENDYETK